jgi:hypothetical protein
MKEFVGGVVFRLDGLIRAHESTGPASGAIPLYVGHLLHDVDRPSNSNRRRDKSFRLYYPLDFNGRLDSLNRAYSGASSAPLAPVIPPADYIWKLS